MRIYGDNEHPGSGKIKCLNCGKPVKNHSLLEPCDKGDGNYPKRMKKFVNRQDITGKRRTGARVPK